MNLLLPIPRSVTAIHYAGNRPQWRYTAEHLLCVKPPPVAARTTAPRLIVPARDSHHRPLTNQLPHQAIAAAPRTTPPSLSLWQPQELDSNDFPEMETEEAKVVKLKPIEATPSTFKDYGQVVEASPDGQGFGPHDAQLDLSHGTPRFYIMHLENRPLKFSSITHHASVTQCLGSIGGHVWYLGVAKPSIVDSNEIKDDTGKKIVQSRSGHQYVPPAVEEVQVFKISGPKFLKLNRGTWHAGPLFKTDAMDFYNLELSNTNVVDHTTHNFKKDNGVIFLIDE